MIELVGNVDPTRVLAWLERDVRPSLTPDVSGYARGRLRTWLGVEPSLTSPTRLTPGLPLSAAMKRRLEELISWPFDYCLVTYSGDQKPSGILPHRDASFADYEGYGWNLSGTCHFSYWLGRPEFGKSPNLKEYNPREDPPTHTLDLKPGDLIHFNVKNFHAASPSHGRWGVNFWRAKDAPVKSSESPPADPPPILYWKLSTAPLILKSVLHKELAELAESRDHNSSISNHVVCRRKVPAFVEVWSLSPDGPWRPLTELPKHWFPKEDVS